MDISTNFHNLHSMVLSGMGDTSISLPPLVSLSLSLTHSLSLSLTLSLSLSLSLSNISFSTQVNYSSFPDHHFDG